MTLKHATNLLEIDGYKKLDVTSSPLTFHTTIVIKGGRVRKPSKSAMCKFYMGIPIIARLEIKREIKIFSKRIIIWSIPNVARSAFKMFEQKGGKL